MRILMQKPVLAIGLILFTIFILQVSKNKKLPFFNNERFIATSCKAALVRIEKNVPENWKTFCEGNNMAVEIKELAIPENATNLRALMYRQLANHMSFIARTSMPDILEKVDLVRFRIDHPKMVINAVTEGRFIVKLATLESPEHIMTHLQTTVQVKEDMK